MNATTQQQQTALSLPERAAVALGTAAHEAALRELVKSSADIVAVIDPAGRDQAHRIGMNLKTARVNIEKAGKSAREDATAFSKAIIAEEKRLVAMVEPEEGRVLSLRDQFDAAEQRRKDALIAAERARTERISAAIQAIREIPISMAGKSSQDISNCIAGLVGTIPDESYEEFIEQANSARLEALDKLAEMEAAQRGIEVEAESRRQEAARVAAAEEQARLAEAARIEAERAENARVKAENDRIAAEQAKEAQRLAEVAAQQQAAILAQQQAIEAQAQAERDAQAAVAAEAKRQMEAQQAAIAEQSRKLAEQQAAADARDAAAAAAIKAAEDAAIAKAQDDARREDDHGPALMMNAEFDAAREAERVRLQDLHSQAVADLVAPEPSVTDLADAVSDDEITNEEIEAMGHEVGYDLRNWVERLDAFVLWARAEKPEIAA